ncbi:hypothetical protein GMMP15_850009 [Candidatus Magnetomoraceae bacterium gMMP-15]
MLMSRQNNSFISHVITMKTTHNKNVKKARKKQEKYTFYKFCSIYFHFESLDAESFVDFL